MCQYRNKNMCSLTSSICPWAYWCGNVKNYKERESYKYYCKFLKQEEEKVPDGYYKVEFERHGFLYINFDHSTIKIKNPFEDIPKFVKVKKTKTSYKVSK